MIILLPNINHSSVQVERLEIGALVSIRGIGRVTIVKFIEVSQQ